MVYTSYNNPTCPYCKTIFSNWKDNIVDPRIKEDIFTCKNCNKKFSTITKIMYSFECKEL